MTRFDPQISGVRSDHSTNCATTNAHRLEMFILYQNVEMMMKIVDRQQNKK